MKKLFTLISIASVPFLVSAQSNRATKINGIHSIKVDPSKTIISGNESYAPVALQKMNRKSLPANFVTSVGTATKIGETTYDLQTNNCMSNRIIAYPDGKISAVWTFATDVTTAFTDRGSGYNHFDGTTWGPYPSTRLEGATRTGWPTICQDGAGKELIFSHAGTAPNGRKSVNASIGSTAWTTSPALQNANDLIWQRAANIGTNVFVLSSATAPGDVVKDPVTGILGANRWSRSTDGGATWVEENVTNKFPGYDSVRFNDGGGDEYAIAVRGNTVAVLYAGLGKDIVFWKSTDAGATFTKTVVQEFAIASWGLGAEHAITDTNADGNVDTLETTASAAVGIDPNNNVHVAWQNMATLDDDPADESVSIIFRDGIRYWSENNPTITTPAFIVDVDGDGEVNIGSQFGQNGGRYGNAGLCNHPNIVFGASGQVHIIYIAPTENDTTDATLSPIVGQQYNDLYSVTSLDNGATFGDPLNITNPTFDPSLFGFEDAFPVAYQDVVNGNVHLTYQLDTEPGTFLGTPADAVGNNEIYYYSIPEGDLLSVKNSDKLQGVNIKSYPNPSNGNVKFQLDLDKAMKVEISITNLLGQKVASVANETFPNGTHTLERDLSNLSNGIYFYTVSSNGKNITEKIIISK
jgi:hypothetical protein